MADRDTPSVKNTRVKRRRAMSPSDSDSGSSSDEEGGVSLDPKNWGSSRKVKKESTEAKNGSSLKKLKKEPPDPEINAYKTHAKVEVAENGLKHRQTPVKNEPLETKYNPYLAHMEAEQNEEPEAKYNPYLAHREPKIEEEETGYRNGYGHGLKPSRTMGASSGTTIGHFPRHETTAAMAIKAENGPNNPFTGRPLSSQYFNILKTRRNLPVHSQRSVSSSISVRHYADYPS